MFKSLLIEEWRQYDKIDINFHERLTILTGANGAGKTTILNLLNRHFGWNINFVSTLRRDKRFGRLKYVSDIWRRLKTEQNQLEDANNNNNIVIGNIQYKNCSHCELTVPSNVSFQYNIGMKNQLAVKGLHIPSHRPIYSYQQVNTIPTIPKTKEQVYREYFNVVHNNYISYSQHKANRILKETLISLATFGYGNEVVVPDKEALQTFEEFQDILKIVLPPKLGFQKIQIRMPEVILKTDSGDFSIDAVSGGIAAIIDLAWQIFMYKGIGEEYVVTLDEPENHLHPEMQRMLIPNLLEAFPKVQFIVATHNPFIVSSVPSSNVYVLHYNENKKVFSTLLDMVNKAGSSNDILRDVLGVPVAMPIWVEEKLDNIVKNYVSLGISGENIGLLREEMKLLGLDKFIPMTIGKLFEDGEQND